MIVEGRVMSKREAHHVVWNRSQSGVNFVKKPVWVPIPRERFVHSHRGGFRRKYQWKEEPARKALR